MTSASTDASRCRHAASGRARRIARCCAARKELRRLKSGIDQEFRRLVAAGVEEGALAPCDPKITAFAIAGAHEGNGLLSRSNVFGAVDPIQGVGIQSGPFAVNVSQSLERGLRSQGTNPCKLRAIQAIESICVNT